MTELAEAKYSDGSTPEIIDVVRLAAFLFAAGQETTTKLLGFGMRVICEGPDIQASLREDRSRIPAFIEETLRIESPVKSHFRMARTSTTVGDVAIPAGTTVMLLPGASNRDPQKFSEPDKFRADRPNVREHVAFGRGIHSCPGAPLARAEGRISFNRILDRMGDIRVSDAEHGPADARRYCLRTHLAAAGPDGTAPGVRAGQLSRRRPDRLASSRGDNHEQAGGTVRFPPRTRTVPRVFGEHRDRDTAGRHHSPAERAHFSPSRT